VLLAIGSNLSKGEGEPIYLPFAVWLLPAAAGLPGRDRRGWLAAQLALALVVQLGWRLRW
jgi:methylthioxylose transferase